MTDSPVLALAKDLISRQSVTPEDAGCQDLMIERLKALGFEIEVMVFEDTTNFWLAVVQKRHYLRSLATPMWYLLANWSTGIHIRLNQLLLMVTYTVAVQRT